MLLFLIWFPGVSKPKQEDINATIPKIYYVASLWDILIYIIGLKVTAILPDWVGLGKPNVQSSNKGRDREIEGTIEGLFSEVEGK